MTMTKKTLLIANQVTSVDLEKKEIVIRFNYKPFLLESIEKADTLLAGLMEQKLDYFSNIPIRGLTLTWEEFTEDEEEGNNK